MNAISSSPSPADTESSTTAPAQTTLNTLANSRRSISSSFRSILLAGPSKHSTTPKPGPSSSSSSSSPADHGRRRSIAHRPSLLGFEDDDEDNLTDSSRRLSSASASSAAAQQQEAADWHDVSLEFDVERLASDSTTTKNTRPRSSPVHESIPLSDFPSSRTSIQDHKADRQYRVDDTVFDADDDHDDPTVHHHHHSEQTQSYGAPDEDDDDDETHQLRSTPTSYNPSSSHQHHHHPLYSAHDTSEMGARLDFQALTKSEKTSYAVTTLLVLLLSIVAVGIGSDWIGKYRHESLEYIHGTHAHFFSPTHRLARRRNWKQLV